MASGAASCIYSYACRCPWGSIFQTLASHQTPPEATPHHPSITKPFKNSSLTRESCKPCRGYSQTLAGPLTPPNATRHHPNTIKPSNTIRRHKIRVTCVRCTHRPWPGHPTPPEYYKTLRKEFADTRFVQTVRGGTRGPRPATGHHPAPPGRSY